ncbi:hypothetical protein BH11MYX1_BH11MYX1_20950 [soil metagenome]
MNRRLIVSSLLGSALAAAQPAPELSNGGAPQPPADPAAPAVLAPAPPPTSTLVEALAAPTGDPVGALEPKTSGSKDGFLLEASDGHSKLTVGGIAQVDGRFFVSDDNNVEPDQFLLRSLRFDLRGTLYDHFDFRFMPDFAGSKILVQDAYVDVRYSDVLKLRFGKFKVPFGIERLQSEGMTIFAERGLPNQIAPNRDVGVERCGELGEGTLSYQIGIVNGVADGSLNDGDATDDKELAARFFVRPFATTGPTFLTNLGFGAAATFGDKQANLTQPDVPVWKTSGQTTIFQFRAGTTLADTVVADGRHDRVTAQGYWFVDRLGVIADYVRSAQEVVLGGNHVRVSSDAWEAVAQVLLTDDDATYNSVTPKHPFDPKTGAVGAFDVKARIGELRTVNGSVFANYADPTRSARRAWSGGVGVDWWANRSFRALLDVERTWFTGGAKAAGAVTDRIAETSLIGRIQLVF